MSHKSSSGAGAPYAVIHTRQRIEYWQQYELFHITTVCLFYAWQCRCKTVKYPNKTSGYPDFKKYPKIRICQSETDMQTTPDEKSFDPGHHWGNSRYCFYCNNCTNFVQLCLTKIIIIVATRCQILRLKCIKFDFGWWGSLQRSPDPVAAPPQELHPRSRPFGPRRFRPCLELFQKY